jgi:hypothetical protein
MIKTHRVGTLTLGGMLVVFGILFLLRIFFTGITFDLIFRLWPVIFIFLGLEILTANFIQKEEKLIYDKTAFALIIILSFFAMGMSIVEFCMEHINTHVHYIS